MSIARVLSEPEKHDGFFLPKSNTQAKISQGERQLWCAVVHQALSEPEGYVRKWINSRDFVFIMEGILGIDAEAAREKILQKLFTSYRPFSKLGGQSVKKPISKHASINSRFNQMFN